MGNYLLSKSQASYEDIKQKSSIQLIFQNQLDQVLKRLMKDYLYLQELKYITNDKYNLILSAFDQKRQQKIGICINESKISNVEEYQISKSLIFPAEIIQNGKLILEVKNMDNYLVYFLNYDEYLQSLKEQCNQQKTADINFLTENHHLITNLYYCAAGRSQIVPQDPINIMNNFKINANSSLKEENCIFLGNQISKCLFLKQLSFTIPNNFIQKGCSYLGHQLSQCIYLEKIDIDIQNNYVSSQDVQPLFLSLSRFIHLNDLLLNLSFNYIGKAIDVLSENLLKCKKIEKLSLILSRIDFFNLEKLASAISKLELLTTLGLSLSYNQISQQEISSLFSQISKCSNLKGLYLSLIKNEIDEQTALCFSQALQNLKQLNKISLDFIDNKLNDEGLTNLFQGIDHLNKIEEFSIILNQNKITSNGFKNFGEEIGKCESINLLRIVYQNNSIDEQGIIDFMKGLKSLKNLQRFICFLNNNYQSKGLSQALNELSENCNQIQEIKLQLQNNSLKDNTSLIASSFQRFQQLQNLNISLKNNNINEQELSLFAENISKLPQLTILELDLENNQIKNSENIQKFGFYLSQINTLQKLTLSFAQNQIENQGAFLLVDSLSNSPGLTTLQLFLNSNLITEEGFSLMAKSFAKYKNLSSLILFILNLGIINPKSFKYILKIKKLVFHYILF